MRDFDPGGAVAAERGPQPEDHAARLIEAHLVVGLLSALPAKRLVEGACPGEVGDAERHQAYPLFHDHSIRPRTRRSLARNGHDRYGVPPLEDPPRPI